MLPAHAAQQTRHQAPALADRSWPHTCRAAVGVPRPLSPQRCEHTQLSGETLLSGRVLRGRPSMGCLLRNTNHHTLLTGAPQITTQSRKRKPIGVVGAGHTQPSPQPREWVCCHLQDTVCLLLKSQGASGLKGVGPALLPVHRAGIGRTSQHLPLRYSLQI